MSGPIRFLLIVVLGLSVVWLVLRMRQSRPAPMPAVFSQVVTYDDALAVSRDTGKPVLAFFTADWCGPCQRFKRGALADEDVERVMLERTIPVYVDVDKQPSLGRSFSVSSIPTLVLIKDGQTIARRGGGTASDVIEWIEMHAEKTLP